MEDIEKLPIEKWTEGQVSSWLRSIGIKETYVSKLYEEEVDGQVLLEITEDDLKSKVGMKLGPALLIINKRNQLVESVKKKQKVQGKQQQPTTKERSGGPEDAGEPQIEKEPESQKDVEKPIQQRPFVANETSGSQEVAEDKKIPEEETKGPSVVMPFMKRDCKPRPFGKEGINFTYISSNVLHPETGVSDLISPCHEYKSFATAAKLDRSRLQAKFAKEVLKFGTGCMNIRSNGTIHFGVMDSREDTGYIHYYYWHTSARKRYVC